MCLVKVKQEEDVVIPYRVHRAPSPVRHRRSTHRVSREVIRESRPASSSYIHRPPSVSYVTVPTPAPLAIPAPQPVPVFVQPPPPPPPPPVSHFPSHHGGPHYVEVSPRSSVTSHSPSHSEYMVHEREYRRERNYSPDSSSRYESFRYVEPAPEPEHYEHYERRRSRSRVRERSRSRDYAYDHEPRGGYRETNTRVVINDGRRHREYER